MGKFCESFSGDLNSFRVGCIGGRTDNRGYLLLLLLLVDSAKCVQRYVEVLRNIGKKGYIRVALAPFPFGYRLCGYAHSTREFFLRDPHFLPQPADGAGNIQFHVYFTLLSEQTQ